MDDLVKGVLAGNRRALARMLTAVENQRAGVDAALAKLYPHTGGAWILGVTGAPGTGKSSLVSQLVTALRERGERVAVIAIDPTSPFTGGAILGDRIRMLGHSGDSGVFIRSMATRGSLGGLSRATRDAARVMDAAGYDWVIIETVGAGQSEVDIVRTAYTTIVVEAPGLGDDIQAIKAGILEIADVLVINKADRPGAEQTKRVLKAMLELGHPSKSSAQSAQHGNGAHSTATSALYIPPILSTTATSGEGIAALVEAVINHRQHLHTTGQIDALQTQYLQIELLERLRDSVMQHLRTTVPDERMQAIVQQLQSRQIDPQTAVDRLLKEISLT